MARMGAGELRNVFGHFLRTFNLRPAKAFNDAGGYVIDHSYGGYTIEQVLKSGGVHHPFGGTRRNARELIDVMHFAMSVHHHIENEQRGVSPNPPREHQPHPGPTSIPLNYEVDKTTREHLRSWVDNNVAHNENETNAITASMVTWLQGHQQETGEYYVRKGWSRVFRDMQENGVNFDQIAEIANS